MKRNAVTYLLTVIFASLISCAAPKSAAIAAVDPVETTIDVADMPLPETGTIDTVSPSAAEGAAIGSAAAVVGRAIAVEDSLAQEQLRDEEGQDFSSLFDYADPENHMEIDTSFAWSNSTINSGRFDYKTLGSEDTIRIPLVDSAQGKYFSHPYPGVVTSQFGLRRFLWHYGMDVKLNVGDTVRNAFDGIVRVVSFDRRGYGNVVVVRHHSGIETVYGHLSRAAVTANQRIKAGEMVGLGGNTGRSTGPHLHFEIRYFGEPIDPRHVFNFWSPFELKSDTLVLTRDNFEYLTEARKTVVHTVRRGDNLGSIARRYGTTVNNLCRLNGITPRTTLSIGRRLVVRSGATAQTQVITQPSPDTASSAKASTDVVVNGAATNANTADADNNDNTDI